MPSRFLVQTPLPIRWPAPLGTIARDIEIVETPTFNEENWRFWNLRRTDEDALQHPHWLRVEAECEFHERDGVVDRMAETLRTAMIGFQLWVPKGWSGIIIASQITGDVDRVYIPEAYSDSRWGRMTDAAKLQPEALGRLVEGTLQAFETKSVPVMNPFQFLEIGLQTAMNHGRAGALLWITGLDGLLAAEKRDVFVARLLRLLGKGTQVFPQDWVGREPVYTVEQVARRIFEWRGLVAHGKQILERFRKPIVFEFGPKDLEYLRVEQWTEETLLTESALWCLIAALRKIIENRLMPVLSDKRAWDRWLDGETGKSA